MRLPKWLDRERRIHTLSVQLDAKHQELLAALGQIGKLAYEKGEALMDLDSTRILLDRQRKVDTYLGSEAERQVLEAIEESDMQRARYRYAWLSARRRAERHGLSARAWRSRAEDAERQRKKAAAEHEETIRMLLRQHDLRLVPIAPTEGLVPLGSKDRDNAHRLAEENARLREEVHRLGSEQPGWIDEAAGHSTDDGAPRG